jgi:hypothetical protein
VARLHDGASVDIDCTGNGRVSIVLADPAVGDYRPEGRDFVVVAVCPDNVKKYSWTEQTNEGDFVVDAYEVGVSISGSFRTDDGRVSGSFDVVEQ